MSRLEVEPLTDDERTHFRLVVMNTTPAERIAWLEDMRLAFGVEQLKKAQYWKLRMQDAENALNSPPPTDR